MTNVKSKILVVGKRGSYAVPTKLMSVPQKPKQEHLYQEYWEKKQ